MYKVRVEIYIQNDLKHAIWEAGAKNIFLMLETPLILEKKENEYRYSAGRRTYRLTVREPGQFTFTLILRFFHLWLSRRCQFQRISDRLMKFAPKINTILPNNMVKYRGQIQSLAEEIAVQSSGSLFLNGGNLSASRIFWFFTYKLWWPDTCRVFKLHLWNFYQLKAFSS